MKDPSNPFSIISNQLIDIRKLVLEIKNSSKKDYAHKYYTYDQVSKIIHVSYQTVRNYVKSGKIKAKNVTERKKIIHHYEIFNEDGTIKEFKYKR